MQLVVAVETSSPAMQTTSTILSRVGSTAPIPVLTLKIVIQVAASVAASQLSFLGCVWPSNRTVTEVPRYVSPNLSSMSLLKSGSTRGASLSLGPFNHERPPRMRPHDSFPGALV